MLILSIFPPCGTCPTALQIPRHAPKQPLKSGSGLAALRLILKPQRQSVRTRGSAATVLPASIAPYRRKWIGDNSSRVFPVPCQAILTAILFGRHIPSSFSAESSSAFTGSASFENDSSFPAITFSKIRCRVASLIPGASSANSTAASKSVKR